MQLNELGIISILLSCQSINSSNSFRKSIVICTALKLVNSIKHSLDVTIEIFGWENYYNR